MQADSRRRRGYEQIGACATPRPKANCPRVAQALTTRWCRIRVEEGLRPASRGLPNDGLVDFGRFWCHQPGRLRWARSALNRFKASVKAPGATTIAIRLLAMAAQCAERATPLSPL